MSTPTPGRPDDEQPGEPDERAGEHPDERRPDVRPEGSADEGRVAEGGSVTPADDAGPTDGSAAAEGTGADDAGRPGAATAPGDESGTDGLEPLPVHDAPAERSADRESTVDLERTADRDGTADLERTADRPADRQGGQHASPRPVPPSGRGTAGDDVVVEDLRTGEDRPAGREAGTGTPAGAATGATAAAAGAAGVAAAGSAPPRATTRPATTTGPVADPARDGGPSDDRPARRRDRRPRNEVADLPEPPPRPGFGRHVLGVLVGLVLTPFAFLLTGIGAARLADIAGTDRMGTDALGTTLLVIGILLLAALVLLGAWSPAAPITGGLVWGLALGTAYLVAPRVVEDVVDQAAQGRTPPAAVDQFAQSAMSGMLLLVGVLLLTSGIAAGIARRVGRRWAEQVAAAELARIEAGAQARAA